MVSGVLIYAAVLASVGQADVPLAIHLDPSDAFPTTLIETTQTYTGGCGPAVVRVVGVTDVTGSFFNLDTDGRVVLHSPRGADLVVDASNGLSDHNGIACTTGNGRTRLLIWAACGGSSCGDDYDFTVVDPDKMRVVSPVGSCDEMCAYSLTGSRLPWALNHKIMP